MPLTSLQIHQFRNISAATLQLHPQVNLFYGQNGAGKTSVLEAVAMLARGKSFRSHKLKPLIQQGEASVTSFGRFTDEQGSDYRIGVERSQRGTDQFKVNGKPVLSAAELAQLIPLQTIYSETFALLAGGPGERRQFLDWLVFHVEHDFMGCWREVRQALKQRNSLLRSGRITAELQAPWDKALSGFGERLDALRSKVFTLFQAELTRLLAPLEAFSDLTVEYVSGWDASLTLEQALLANTARDHHLGHTTVGPHRADLKIRMGKVAAEEVLSRGQQKLLVCALRICAARVYLAQKGRRCVFLVDDLPSELDPDNRRRLAQWLLDLEGQVLVTGVERQDLESCWEELVVPRKVFHVEHGQVTASDQNNV